MMNIRPTGFLTLVKLALRSFQLIFFSRLIKHILRKSITWSIQRKKKLTIFVHHCVVISVFTLSKTVLNDWFLNLTFPWWWFSSKSICLMKNQMSWAALLPHMIGCWRRFFLSIWPELLEHFFNWNSEQSFLS